MIHSIQIKPCQSSFLRHHQSGFTLVELMVGMVVGAIVMVGVFSTYKATIQSIMTQRQVADVQQQMRGAQYMMERDVRAAGYDPEHVGTVAAPLGVQDIRRYDIFAAPDPNGNPALAVNFDLDANGIAEQFTYLLYDIGNNGIVDLARFNGGCFELLAEGVEAIGFAYGFDADFDDKVDLYPSDDTGNIIWAVDSDNDNDLDRILDVDQDGDIDTDDLDLPAKYLANAPFNLADVPADRIRIVRVWLLCRSTKTAKKAIIDDNIYVVGDQKIGPFNDTFRRRILEMNIRIRNL